MGVRVHAVLGALALCGLGGTVEADIFVYQLPGGARIVTDHALTSRDYKLVRHSKTSKGAGTLVSSRKIQLAVTDPGSYDRLIQRMARTHQVEPALIKAVMHVESAFNPHAVSDKGAQGLMQVMPETGQRYGVDDLFDPVQNVRAGVLYLRDLQRLFKNNTRLVLAAYNAGENAVLRYRGVPPYDETRDYVVKVTKMHRRYAAQMKDAARIARRDAYPVTAKPVPARSRAPATVPATSSSAPAFVPVAVVQPAAEPAEKNL
jgi:hypothetical protein